MKKFLLFIFVLGFSVFTLAQDHLTKICEVDYYNATRYVGGRNIARTPSGNVVIVFEPGANYTNGSQDIHYAVYNSIFGSWDVAKLSNAWYDPGAGESTGYTGTPALIAHPDSEIVYAVWKERYSDEKRNAMFAKLTFIDAFTHQWTTPVIADNIDNNTGVITVDMADDGTLFNMFSIWTVGGSFPGNIYAGRSVDGGQTWQTVNLTSEFPTPGSLPFDYMDVNLAPAKNGDMYALWEDKPTEITKEYELLFSKYDAAGDSWSRPEIVSPIFDGTAAIHKYVDGVTPVSGAKAVYTMGPEGYQYEGKTTVIYYDNGTSKVLSSFFNPYYMEPEQDKNRHVAEVINFFGISGSDSLLLVDDDNRYDNEGLMTAALDSAGINYTVHDCGNVGGLPNNLPTAARMQEYGMVIWFCGSDGVKTAFWNTTDGDNAELISYLNTADSKLWVIGEDILYDRYKSAPDTFSTGDFCYDYLGIEIYDAQSYADDGKSGVAQLDLVADNGLNVSTVDPIGWGAGGLRQGEPSIASDPYGKLHMAYKDVAGDHIKYQTFDGAVWSEPVQIDVSHDSVNVMRPNIAIDPNFGVYITWNQETGQYAVDDKTYLVYNVFYATSPDGGASWNAPVQMTSLTETNDEGFSVKNPTIGKKVRPAVYGVFDGGADVVWTEYNAESSLGYNIMYGRIPYVGTLTDIAGHSPAVAYEFELQQNYPNPFNPQTTIRYQLAGFAQTELAVYNVLGQKVRTLVNMRQKAGKYAVKFDGAGLPSGVYFAKLQSGNQEAVQKLILMK